MLRTQTIFLLFTFSMAAHFAFGQPDPIRDYNRHVFENWKGEVFRIGPYHVKGSPYLLGAAFVGTITYNNGKTLKNTNILYDIYNQKAGVEVNNQMFEADNPIESFSIVLGGQQLLFKNSYVFLKPEMKCFLSVLEDGKKVALLKVYKSKLAADPTNNMDTKRKVFEQYYDYYIYNVASSTLNAIKLRKKDFTKGLNDDTFLKNYELDHVVDFTREDNLVMLVHEYNAAH